MVALALGANTPARIQEQIIGDTVGNYVRNSNLYAILHRLERNREVERQGNTYLLTDRGWHRLTLETRTLELLTTHAKHRIVSSGHGRW